MARQKGILPIEGTLGNITFFKSKDGYMARQKGGVDASKIATAPNFQRTRENNAEFGNAGRAGKLLRTVFRPLMKNASDTRMVSRLTAQMIKVIRQDAVNIRGQRNVLDGELELLQGFECNEAGKFSTMFFATFTAAIDRAAGTLSVQVPPFIPAVAVLAPAGVTHFRILSAGAAINFTTHDFEVDLQATEHLPWDNQETAAINLTNTVSAATTHPLFLAMSIEFLQQINGQMYPLKSGAYNAMSFVKISGT